MQKFLIVGLGNIGQQYEATRHNIGFAVVDALAKKHEVDFESVKSALKTQFRHKGKTLC